MATQAEAIRTERIPAAAYFVGSAIFHYLGPSFAVLLFARLDVLGVAWLRIASAALVFAVWRRPWRVFINSTGEQRRLLVALGVTLALMNACFYLAIARLPLGTVGAIEFVGQIILAAIGIHSRRNGIALGLALVGGGLLTNVQWAAQPLGLLFAFVNGALFMLYVVLGHRVARDGGGGSVDRLGAAMLMAFVVICPIGFREALPAFGDLQVLLSGVAVGICSSVIPYVLDQLAMRRLPRATFALMLCLLPAFAVIIGAVVLGQVPSVIEVVGVVLIMAAVGAHQPGNEPHPHPQPPLRCAKRGSKAELFVRKVDMSMQMSDHQPRT